MFCVIDFVDAQQLASAAGCSRISPRARLFTPFFRACEEAVARSGQQLDRVWKMTDYTVLRATCTVSTLVLQTHESWHD